MATGGWYDHLVSQCSWLLLLVIELAGCAGRALPVGCDDLATQTDVGPDLSAAALIDLSTVDVNLPDLAPISTSLDLMVAATDMTAWRDMTARPDMTSVPRDMTQTRDMTALRDMTATRDMTVPRDMTTQPDLANSCNSVYDCPSSVCISNQCAPHYNDDCASALPLLFVNGTCVVQSTLVYATNGNQSTDASPTCSADARTLGVDAVFYFDLAETASLAIAESDMQGSLYPVLYVRRGGACSSPSASDELGCGSTNAGADGASVYLSNLSPGRYYIWVDSRGYLPTTYTLTASLVQ